MRRYRILILLFIFIFSVALGMSAVSKIRSSWENPTQIAKIVTLTDQGFAPEELGIERGTTVEFRIEGQREHWPASNFHPTHEEYPEGGGCLGSTLDSCRGLKKGETYSFTFNKTGVFGMHDHLFPGLTMVIKVKDKHTALPFPHTVLLKDIIRLVKRSVPVTYEEPTLTAEESAQAAYERCNGDERAITCYAKHMEDIAFAYGKKYAYATLSALKKIDSTTNACHFYTHGIGWGLAKKDPDNWREALKQVSAECAYGEAHGVIEYYVNISGGKITRELAKSICGKATDLGCSHPLGHIFLVETKGDMDATLDLCDSLGPNGPNCYHGAFMEHHVQGNLLLHGLADPKRRNWTDFIYEDGEFCMKYKGQGVKETACWGRLAHSAYGEFDKDPRRIFDFCNTGPSVEANRQCKLISFAEILPPSGMDFMKYKGTCKFDQALDPEFEGKCYTEFIKLAFAHTADLFPKTAPYCLSLTGSYRTSCIATIGSQITYRKVNKDLAAKICAPVKDAHLKSVCLGEKTI